MKVRDSIEKFVDFLYLEEKSENTIMKYRHDIQAFFLFLGQEDITKEKTLRWKEQLSDSYKPSSVNSMLAALNTFLIWSDKEECKVKPLRIQPNIFTAPEKELTYEDYKRLVQTAKREGNLRLAMLLQTLCSTGIRISELNFITVESLSAGRINVNCKGKNRTIFMTKKLRSELQKYCKGHKVMRGSIFCTKSGKPMDRSNIWKEMKQICKRAEVGCKKVFPHNLRHLFAQSYYRIEKDISKLADLLGHSNINTTRIYTMESGEGHAQQIERLDLVCT